MSFYRDLAHGVTSAAIARHFLCYDNWGKVKTGRNDHKCKRCNYGLRRRFKTVPNKLGELIEERILHQFHPEEGKYFRATAEELKKDGDVYKDLETIAEDAVHTWMDEQTYMRNSISRKCYSQLGYYDPFELCMKYEADKKKKGGPSRENSLQRGEDEVDKKKKDQLATIATWRSGEIDVPLSTIVPPVAREDSLWWTEEDENVTSVVPPVVEGETTVISRDPRRGQKRSYCGLSPVEDSVPTHYLSYDSDA
jgi:hypothetical protein